MKTKEERAAELIEKLGTLLEGDGSLPEKLKALATDVDELKGLDIKKALEEIDKIRAAQESLRESIRTTQSGVYIPGLEDTSKQFSLVRFLNGVRYGRNEKDWSNVGAGFENEVIRAVQEKAAQSVGDDSLGGYFVPDQVIPEVIEAIYTKSVFIALDGEGETVASVIAGLTGGNIRIPKFNGGVVAYWIGEEGTYTESLANVGEITMNPKKAGVLVKLTDSMRQLGAYGFENLLRRDMVKAAAKLIDNAVLYGVDGDNVPRGIANHPEIKIYSAEAKDTAAGNTVAELTTLLADWQGAELDFTGLDNMALALEEDDVDVDATTRHVFAPRYRRRLGNLKVQNFSGQTANQPFLLGAPMLSDQRIADIIGAFSKFNQIPTTNVPGSSVSAPTTSTTAKYSDVLFGNMGEIVIGRWGGLEVDDDRGLSSFPTDHTFIKLRMRMDVQVRQPRALVLCPDALVRD